MRSSTRAWREGRLIWSTPIQRHARGAAAHHTSRSAGRGGGVKQRRAPHSCPSLLHRRRRPPIAMRGNRLAYLLLTRIGDVKGSAGQGRPGSRLSGVANRLILKGLGSNRARTPAAGEPAGQQPMPRFGNPTGLPARSARWRCATRRRAAHRYHQQLLGNRLDMGNQPADPRTWPPQRDDMLIFSRTGHVSGQAS
jgi:hypothetical protein